MKVTGITGQIPAGQTGMSQGTDAVSREIKNQIAAAQKKLQAVSSDAKMSMEEKMKKRQEIQKEICDLQNQLRQHEIEMRQEQQGDASRGSSLEQKEEAFDEEKKVVSHDEEKSDKEENEEQINIFADVKERKSVNQLV